jgi:restriction endonuclease Mrr
MSIDIEKAKKAIKEHYAELSKEEFLKNLQESSSEFFDDTLLSGPRVICDQGAQE